MTLTDFVIRILFAVLCGFIIGFERQIKGHMAGIQVNVLVSLGACVFVLFSIIMDAPDTTRIAAQIVTGVGFLCTGIIFKDGVNVRGLNTAATIWCTAAIGVLSSSGNILFAFVVTMLLLITNLSSRMITNKIHLLDYFDEREKIYKVNIKCSKQIEQGIRRTVIDFIAGMQLSLINLETEETAGNNVAIVASIAYGHKRQDDIVEKLVEKISLEADVTKVGWKMDLAHHP
jgi:putative Mg2+ transporter-C (MgtC) family protein